MAQPVEQTAESPAPPKETNAAAKLAVASALSAIGGKIGFTTGLATDLSNLMPKELNFWQKLIKALDLKNTLDLFGEAVKYQQELKGRGTAMATLAAGKWTIILTTIGTIVPAVIGWVLGGRLKSSDDLVNHPIKSLKILVGLEEPEKKSPEPSEKVVGKHTAKVVKECECAKTAEAEPSR